MADVAGRSTNGFAEPERFIVHTLWSWDNHEPTHVYTALIGTPPDFFNEGIAVALQTDPRANDFEPRFNGERLHDAAANYLRQGRLVPLDQIVESQGVQSDQCATFAYREAGSFMLFLLERHGLEPVKVFFRTGARADTRTVVYDRFTGAFASSLQEEERVWLAQLRSR